MTLGHDLRVLDTMYNLGLLMTLKTSGVELRVVDAMNNSGLWMT